MPMTTDPPPFTICSNETISVNSSLRQNEQQLWKIVEKQRSVIQDLQEELSRARIDRNNLLTQLETARQQLLQLEKCNGHEYQEPPAVVDDDQQSPLRGSQSSSSSGSSSNSSCPVPPPRSPYRQHNCSADLQDSSAAGASPTVVRPAKSMDETTAMDPSSPPRSSFTSSRPVSPTFKKSRSPVSVILDKDAQVFAKYQESLLLHSRKDGQQQQRDTRLWSPPPPRPPAPPPHQQHQRHVRRASSQPAISQNPPPQHFFATAKDEMPPASKVIENSLDELSVKVLGSNITTNHKGKGVISFTISVQRGSDELWRIEKLYSDFLALDAQLKSINKVRSRESKVNKLPDKALFATHTPNKANQRKLAIEKYLQHVVDIPWQNLEPLCDFLSSNKVDKTQQLKSLGNSGYKEGYLTKRSKNFRGWKTRYFVLQKYVLKYYESKNGALVGTIHIPDTQIVRHHTPAGVATSNDAAHAFMIVEPKKASSPGSGVHRHILCAESDAERDEWIEALTRCQFASAKEKKSNENSSLPRPASPSTSTSRKISKDDIRPIAAVPLAKAQEGQQRNLFDSNNKLLSSVILPPPRYYLPQRSNSDTSVQPNESAISDTAVSIITNERPPLRQRSSMDQAYLTSKQNTHRRGSLGQVVIQSCGINGSSSGPQSPTDESSEEKRKKAGRRTFWTRRIFTGDTALGSMSPANGLRGFLSRSSSDSNSTEPVSPKALCATPSTLSPPMLRVFGVPLEEAVKKSRVSPKCELPAIVYRCIEYLEAKKATQEEGIYRLSGSAVKIKSLKQQFDSIPDFNLLESGEYHDIHAVAGVLKMWLRELPGNVLTQELLGEFIPVIDLVDRQERVNELGRLVSMLPLANYTLLRVLCAHLIRVVQHSETNKMNARNVGIIFSPTLKIPSSIFSLFLSEFEYIFWTNDDSSIPAGYNSSKNSRSLSSSSTDEESGYFTSTTADIHPTEQVPAHAAVMSRSPHNTRILRDDQGRNNRNSVHYMDSVPLSMVGLENGNAVVADDEDDVEDLEIENNGSLGEDIEDDAEEEELEDSNAKWTVDPLVSEKS